VVSKIKKETVWPLILLSTLDFKILLIPCSSKKNLMGANWIKLSKTSNFMLNAMASPFHSKKSAK